MIQFLRLVIQNSPQILMKKFEVFLTLIFLHSIIPLGFYFEFFMQNIAAGAHTRFSLTQLYLLF